MIVTGKSLSRRTVLKGLGAAIGLPFLDAMTPAFARTAAAGPVRLAWFYLPNGIDMRYWTPATEGALGVLPGILTPFEPVKNELLVLSNLTTHWGRPLQDGAGDHGRALGSYMTGVKVLKTAGADLKLGVSADQIGRLDPSLPQVARQMWAAPAIAIGTAVLVATIAPTRLLLALPLIALWLLSPAIAYITGRPLVHERQPLDAGERATLRKVARKTWRFFEDLLGPVDHWLVPDNYQEDPRPTVAKCAMTCDVLVMPDGLTYVSDWNAGLHVLQYEG